MLALVTVALVAAAQDGKPDPQERQPAPRAAVFGLVKNDQRQPWPAARVQLLSRPVAETEKVGTTDLVQAVTDARGQFRAMVRVGWTYTAWADSAMVDGVYRVSNTVEHCVAGRPIALTQLATPRRRGRIEITGLDAWKARAPFSVQLVAETGNVHVVPVGLDDKHGFTLPRLPNARHSVEIFDARGVPLHVTDLGRDAEQVSVPPPQDVEIRVRAGFGGKPVAKARILRRVRSHDHALGRTDAEGVARLRVPEGTNAYGFRVQADGFARGFPGAEPRGSTKWIADLMAMDNPVSCRVLLTADKPAVHLAVRMVCEVYRSTGALSGSTFQDTVMVRTDHDGRFTVPSPEQALLHAVLDARHEVALKAATLDPVVYLSDHKPATEYRLDSYRLVRLVVQRADGSPATAAEVLLGERPLANPKWKQPSWITDQRGEVALRLPALTPIGVLAMAGGQHGICRLEVGAAPRAARETAQGAHAEVRLEEPIWLRGVIVDAKGAPVKRAGVFCSPKYDGFLGRLPPPFPDAAEPKAARVSVRRITDPTILHRFLALALNHRDRFRRRGPEFAYPLPRVPWRYFINAYEIGAPGGRQLSVEVDPEREKPVRIELSNGAGRGRSP